MFITQISVYLENVRGTLRAMTKVLAENNIDIMALSIADTTNFGIVRLIIRGSSIDKAVDCLKSAGFIVKKSNVICVGVCNQAGALDKVLEVIEETDISIEYMYSFNYNLNGDALFVLRLSDTERIIELLKERNIRMYSQDKIDKL